MYIATGSSIPFTGAGSNVILDNSDARRGDGLLLGINHKAKTKHQTVMLSCFPPERWMNTGAQAATTPEERKSDSLRAAGLYSWVVGPGKLNTPRRL